MGTFVASTTSPVGIGGFQGTEDEAKSTSGGGSGPDQVSEEINALICTADAVIPAPDFSKKDTYEDHEAIEILANWQQSRRMIDDARKARGFPPAKVQKFDLRDIKAKIKCFFFKNKGYMKRDLSLIHI